MAMIQFLFINKKQRERKREEEETGGKKLLQKDLNDSVPYKILIFLHTTQGRCDAVNLPS